MLVENATKSSMLQAARRSTFFRQSGWLMFANIAGGILMWAVHLLNSRLPGGDYGSFGTFLAVVMVLPTIPLQMVLAQQTAEALARGKEGELSGIIRFIWWVTSLVWLGAAVIVLVFQQPILAHWKMTDPVGLWVTLPVVLLSLWLPMFWGVLQGGQNFLWLGWSMMANGIGRITIACLAVLVLSAGAAGMMAGVLLGIIAAVAIAAWQTRSLWLAKPRPFDRGDLASRIFPLILGFLGFQILFTADTILVKGYFAKELVDSYVSAGTMSRALTWLVLPLASVMFPRLVHGAAKSEKSNLMGMVFLGTGLLAVVGALGLSLVGPLVFKLIFPKFAADAPSLLPWYVFAMVPLAMANVLLNNLLAQPASKLLPALCILGVSLGYLAALTQFHGSRIVVLQTMGISNLALLAVCAWFTWGRGPQARPGPLP